MGMTFEILISTMFREDLGFLNSIFKYNDINNFNILIVNQTTENKLLHSQKPNIRIINFFERGSPASRNLAIRNSNFDVCLMSDDDIVYQPNLKQFIENAYAHNPDAAMISFEAIDEYGELYTNYYPAGKHNKKSLIKIFTWVISFKREVFKSNQIFFNHYFGVGSVFQGSTEYVFLRNAFDKGLKMIHENQVIVMHPNLSSGRLMGSDDKLYSRAALQCRFIGNLSYLWLIKYIFFIWRFNYIKFMEIPDKFKIGLKGINAYKSLSKSGDIDKIYED